MGPLKKQASSAAEISQRTDSRFTNEPENRSESFGSRLLTTEQDVFKHNAWDHVEPDDEYIKYAEQQIRFHHENPVPAEKKELYNTTPATFWDSFYANNQNKFFKDRHWLQIEFAELFEWTTESSKFQIMEVGCGAGNAVFPLLEDIYDPRLFVYACDYSSIAVDVVKASKAYDQQRCAAFVWDLASTKLPPNVAPESIDIMLMVFVFSALHPSQWKQAVANAYQLLKPGGVLLFRDYGRNDLAQLRFKKSRLLEDNLYIRGDGTRVYFFTNEELAEVFGSLFEIEQNAIDRRLLINRKRELKMYRVWLQAKFRKPIK
ncbi:hypothetical protein COEREDRAFT_37213 [Coemansia reversa NRRL 1564]|uniref:tRNA N(3)-methylcytidine methyltransferase n=1 Tax=Coemansia reversa (strain ATCC 12441 / NRRL 1564) TaxID=763665 RepID=A0A2G5BJC7_COERN|nr:hypothetical protein COEREDRAFT_37213 [Coemansia reversa NRRL 1564]|eukprot:PIA19115.1 hypothetical protein COEREDRAFT_37213 [Coemansia reversa NRRL 1564]